MANQVRCYCFITQNNVPVRGAILSCRRCSDNRVQYARTDVFGTAVFNLPNGDYLFRCECVPNFLTPSLSEYCVTLNNVYCSADLLFPCNFATLNTNPINVTSNVTVNPTTQTPASGSNVPFNSSFPNTPETIARALGLNPSNTFSNNFLNESPGFFSAENLPNTNDLYDTSTPSANPPLNNNANPISSTRPNATSSNNPNNRTNPVNNIRPNPAGTARAMPQNTTQTPRPTTQTNNPQRQTSPSTNVTRSSPNRTGTVPTSSNPQSPPIRPS